MSKTLFICFTFFLFIATSIQAADKVVVIPLSGSGSGDTVPTVTSKTGRIWMDRNLGALRVAGSKSDSLAYGWLYQWGRPADGHESRTSPSTTTPSSGDVPGHGNFIISKTAPFDWTNAPDDTLWQGVNGKNNPCPEGFRLPTVPEWISEINSWNSKDADGAYGSVLRLVMAGWREYYDGFAVDGLHAKYSTSTTAGTSVYSISISDSYAGTSVNYRVQANSVRCIKD